MNEEHAVCHAALCKDPITVVLPDLQDLAPRTDGWIRILLNCEIATVPIEVRIRSRPNMTMRSWRRAG
jgi:hypothetical protein